MSNTKFTEGPWEIFGDWGIKPVNSDNCIASFEFTRLDDGTSNGFDNAHLIVAAPDMYKSLERQRTGLINLIDLNLIVESHIKSVRHEISLIDNELSRARGE